jgi:hypothetical protein
MIHEIPEVKKTGDYVPLKQNISTHKNALISLHKPL